MDDSRLNSERLGAEIEKNVAGSDDCADKQTQEPGSEGVGGHRWIIGSRNLNFKLVIGPVEIRSIDIITYTRSDFGVWGVLLQDGLLEGGFLLDISTGKNIVDGVELVSVHVQIPLVHLLELLQVLGLVIDIIANRDAAGDTSDLLRGQLVSLVRGGHLVGGGGLLPGEHGGGSVASLSG